MYGQIVIWLSDHYSTVAVTQTDWYQVLITATCGTQYQWQLVSTLTWSRILSCMSGRLARANFSALVWRSLMSSMGAGKNCCKEH